MHTSACRALWLLGLTACHSYSPAPVDLAAHAREFAVRVPDSTALRTFLPPAVAEQVAQQLDLTDGLDRGEGRRVAAALHPSCRLARAAAATRAAAAGTAGRLADPELALDFERILADVPHRWLASASLGIGLPIQGRLAAERDLADTELAAALVDLRLAEEAAAHQLDLAWIAWSTARLRSEQLATLVGQLEELAAVASRLAAAGAATTLEARQFTLEHLRRSLELARSRAAEQLAIARVRECLGLQPQADIPLLPQLGDTPLLPDAAARQAALASGPRLAAADAAHAAAERRLRLESKKQWPDLVLAPGWAEEDAQPRATFGLSLPLPLWHQNRHAIAIADGERAAAAEHLRTALEAAEHGLYAAERRLATALAHRDRVANELLPLAARQLDETRRLAELGTLDPFLLLDALVRAHDAQLAWLDDSAAAAVAAAELDTFTWTDPLAKPATGDAR